LGSAFHVLVSMKIWYTYARFVTGCFWCPACLRMELIMIDFDINEIKKSATRFKVFADELVRLDKLVKKGGYNPFLVSADLRKLEGKVPDISVISGLIPGGVEFMAEMKARLDRQQAAQKMAIINELANGLAGQGLKVSGQLPMLMAGPFNLLFDFGAKAYVKVFLGNKAYLLGKTDLDVAKITDLVLKRYNDLFTRDFDAAGFVNDLWHVYRKILRIENDDPGRRVKISRMMYEYVMFRQGRAFLVDPRRENFKPIERVEFACMLSRAVSNRRIGHWEMRMDVAAMGDTKDPLNHIWVPQGRRGQGVNYTTMRFVRRNDE